MPGWRFLLTLTLPLLSSCELLREHPSDAELRNQFVRREAAIEELDRMFALDERCDHIRLAGTTAYASPAGCVPDTRLATYATPLRAAGIWRIQRRGDVVMLAASGTGLAGGSVKGFLRSPREIAPRRESLDDHTRFEKGSLEVAALDRPGWYLFIWR